MPQLCFELRAVCQTALSEAAFPQIASLRNWTILKTKQLLKSWMNKLIDQRKVWVQVKYEVLPAFPSEDFFERGKTICKWKSNSATVGQESRQKWTRVQTGFLPLSFCLTQNDVGVVQVLPMFLVFVLVGHKTQCGGWSKLWRVGDSRPPVPFIFGWPADPMVMDKLCAIIHQHLVNCRATSQYLYSDQIVLQHQWKPGSVSNIGPVAAASLVRSFSSAFS